LQYYIYLLKALEQNRGEGVTRSHSAPPPPAADSK